eukprot:scaffold264869_cov19-Prasinocladus_malaysianus.AAC.1
MFVTGTEYTYATTTINTKSVIRIILRDAAASKPNHEWTITRERLASYVMSAKGTRCFKLHAAPRRSDRRRSHGARRQGVRPGALFLGALR